MFMVKLSDGQLVFRLDTAPAPGETIAATYPVTRPPKDDERFDPAKSAYVKLTAAELKAVVDRQIEPIIAQVKADAERQKMMVATPGGYKKSEYPDKRAEVKDWDSLGGTLVTILAAFNLLTPAQKNDRFPYIMKNAAAFGDQPKDAVARIRGGMARASSVHDIAAHEDKICAALRAAKSMPEVSVILGSINWNWRAPA